MDLFLADITNDDAITSFSRGVPAECYVALLKCRTMECV